MIELTLEDFKYFSKKQELLDNEIKKQKNISDDEWKHDLDINHTIALKIEIAEFVNECSDIWKYWKDKQPNKERIIDEAIDVLHFVFLRINKENRDINDVHELYTLANEQLKRNIENGKYDLKNALNNILKYNNKEEKPELLLLVVLSILTHYEFTREDIIEQYNKKNAINFERLENGY